jgi:hypothetical protein
MYTDSAVEYFPFIQERLMSTFIHLSSLKAMPFHINENTMPYELQRLNSLKATNQLEQWLDLRQEIRKQMYPKSIDWAKTWINERNKSYVL